MKIECADKTHLPEILLLNSITHQEHHDRNPNYFSERPPISEWKEVLTERMEQEIGEDGKSGSILVCLDEHGRVVGYLTFSSVFQFVSKDGHASEPNFYVDDISVGIEYRRSGVGSLLLEHLIECAREAGIRRIIADVWFGNEASTQFFKTAEFSPVRTEYSLDLG